LSCQETQELIHGYLDGELDLVKSLEIERHLQSCPACARAHTDFQKVRSALKGSDLYFSPPSALRDRIRLSLGNTGKAARAPRVLTRRWLALAASLALVAITGWALVTVLSLRRTDSVLTQELVASHVRSQQQPNHRFDVQSSKAHTVKPWFEGKLDFSPPVHDLAGQGFPLLGGRLDYLDNRPVAALVYGRRKHLINLFIWRAADSPESTPSSTTRQGYHLVNWTHSGMTFWAVSNLNESELEDFARLIQEKSP
jgi:anti-sigma factor RsiW